jgi:ribosomal protein L3 glutamine methyltransferase
MTDAERRLDDLVTLRDWLRYGVSRFNAAGLSYGHGTETALDEAAFLLLSSLELEPDDLAPWLEARLTRPERARIDGLIEARIATRRPAPYLVGRAYIRGRRFICDERAIVPRSFIAELICDLIDRDDVELEQFLPPFPLPASGEVRSVLDLCTGGGSIAILASEAFPGAQVDAVDISREALALAAENVALWKAGEHVRLIEGDLFAGLAGRRYDLILSNPPYVTDTSLAAFPLEHRAEPALAHSGGADGLDLVRRIIGQAGAHLAPGGQLIVEVGAGREAVEQAFPELDFLWLDTRASEGEVLAIAAEALPGWIAGGSTRARRRAGRA